MDIKPIYELLLWNNCNNNCKFCFMKHNHHDNKFLSDENKEKSLKLALDVLNSPDYIDGSHVLIVGGELFDNKFPDHLEKSFFTFLDTIVSYMVSGKIDLLYVNTNLIYKDLNYLYYLLNNINKHNLFERLKFTTSYDLYGRFIEDRKETVENNLKQLLIDFPNINIVANMILTKQFCEKVLNKEFSVKEFIDTYKVKVNTIPYIILHEEMAASRDLIYKTLLFLDKEIPGYLKAYVDNVALEQEKLLYEYDGEKYVYMTAKNAKCGHNENFHRYVLGRDRCFICDMLELKEVLS